MTEMVMVNQLNINTFAPPPLSNEAKNGKKQRSSNLELYRIICMLMIVAHHYVVNSGLLGLGGPMESNPTLANSLYLAVFGAWGKVGINCFLMITGYFMCTSRITFRKFLKLLLQIYLYKILLFPILLFAGYESMSLVRIIKLIMPVSGFNTDNFISCFIAFWLTIPFLNILIRNMSRRQHALLILLSLCFFTFFGSLPKFSVPLNYITWFGIIYFIASYIRLYPQPILERRTLWGLLTIITLILAIANVIAVPVLFKKLGFEYYSYYGYFFVCDSNKIFAVAIAVCSFLWFKNLNIGYNKVINAFGAGTFGVLLIHANSGVRPWLWKDLVDCVGHYAMPLGELILYSVGVVLAIFVVCNLVDQLRINTLEKWFFNWYDNKYADRAEAFVGRIINGKQKANL